MIPDKLDPTECGIEGGDDELLTHGKFNRWVARALRHHLRPMKIQLSDTHELLDKHIQENALTEAKILGGVEVLKKMLPILLVVVNAAVVAVVYFLHKAGVIN